MIEMIRLFIALEFVFNSNFCTFSCLYCNMVSA